MSGSAELEDIRLDSETDTDQGVCMYVCVYVCNELLASSKYEGMQHY